MRTLSNLTYLRLDLTRGLFPFGFPMHFLLLHACYIHLILLDWIS